MQSIVTDPSNDYISVSDFDRLAEHVSRSVEVACHVNPQSITTPPLPMCEPGVDQTESSSGNEFTTDNKQITTSMTFSGSGSQLGVRQNPTICFAQETHQKRNIEIHNEQNLTTETKLSFNRST